ncbi:MAG: hypothetical protein ACNA8W_26210, partial [Bradymonadaceae bacterium]
MDRLWRGLLIALLILGISPWLAAEAMPSDDPLPFPAPNFLQDTFFSDLSTLIEDETWTCHAEGRRCRCVLIERPGFQAWIPSWVEEEGKTTLSHIRLKDLSTGELYHIAHAMMDTSSDVIRLEKLTYYDERSEVVLMISRVVLETDRIEATGIGWNQGHLKEDVAELEDTTACRTDARLVDGRLDARAESASHDGRSWRFDGMRLLGGR